MNPEFESTRQALESRLTALILGELDPDQTRDLNEILARDPELSRIHQRLKQTIDLVKVTAAEDARQPAPVPLKLSEQRRQELLQRFKTVTPKEFAAPKRSLASRLAPFVAVAAAIVIFATLMLPAFSRAKSKAQRLRFGYQGDYGTAPASTPASTNLIVLTQNPFQRSKGESGSAMPVATTPPASGPSETALAHFEARRGANIVLPPASTEGERLTEFAKEPAQVPVVAVPSAGVAFAVPVVPPTPAKASPPADSRSLTVTTVTSMEVAKDAANAGRERPLEELRTAAPTQPVVEPLVPPSNDSVTFAVPVEAPVLARKSSQFSGAGGTGGGGGGGGGPIGGGVPAQATPPPADAEAAYRSRYGLGPSSSTAPVQGQMAGGYSGGAGITAEARSKDGASVQQEVGDFFTRGEVDLASSPGTAAPDVLAKGQAVDPTTGLAVNESLVALPSITEERNKSREMVRADNGSFGFWYNRGLGGGKEQSGARDSERASEVAEKPPMLGDLPFAGRLYRSDSPGQPADENGRKAEQTSPPTTWGAVVAGEPIQRDLSESFDKKAKIGAGQTPAPAKPTVAGRSTVVTGSLTPEAQAEGKPAQFADLAKRVDEFSTGISRDGDEIANRAWNRSSGEKQVSATRGSNIVLPGQTDLAWHESAGKDISKMDELRRAPAPAQSAPDRQELTRQDVSQKLGTIQLSGADYNGLPLSEVVNHLNEEAKKKDPQHRGINLILAQTDPGPVDPATGLPVGTPGVLDPTTGLPIAAAAPKEPLDLHSLTVTTNLANKNLRLTDALEAIIKATGKPLQYQIADNGVVIYAADPKQQMDDAPKPKPAAPPPVPQPEVDTRNNAFSTFSLNVSDVSFKLAGASLEKGQMPDPASIRSEEFINAFDYRDPEPPPGIPVAFAWDRAQYPFAQNRDLLRFSIKTAAQGRQAGRPLNIVLLLDNSGSMERADRVQIIRESLKVLAAQLQPADKLSVVTFARTPHLVVDGVPGNQAAPVADELGGLTPQGGTNLEEAMNLAYQTAARHYLANGINRVVLLTDGAANLGNVEPESLKQKVEAQRKQGIALDCFGIGWEGYNDDLLEVLSRNGDGRYGFINTPGEAATEFAGQLAGALQVAASDVKVQVEFNPARVAAYRQIGYAKHQLTKEQFRDNTVDAAEIGAAEAGNALYTVEVNPAGQGPLATVRVRYKIPGTGDYREQEWAVPYSGAAPALELSTPAMRLAATASAFSEWLATSPYAGEATPDRLLGYLRGVPEVYGADARPKKLEWMLRQANSVGGK